MSPPPTEPATRLARHLSVNDAVVVGLGAMLGVGVFAAVGPAAKAAGSGLLIGLAVAAGVAYCNATSSAQLAALYPQSGGTYVYGRARLGEWWGRLAGWGFVVGKTSSCAAMALTVGAYAAPSAARPIAFGAVLGVTAINYRGVRKTVGVTRWLVAAVLAALAVVVVGTLFGGRADSARLAGMTSHGVDGVLQSAGLLFIAFAGYARIATLGEEVRDPETTIPKAIPRALALCLVLYAIVLTSALLAAGPGALAAADAPLATAVRLGDLDRLAAAVRVGGAVAALGVLLSLAAGVSRTVFAMASDGALPRWFAAVHPVNKVPHRAEIAVGLAVGTLAVVTDLRHTLGVSAVSILGYYAITNAAAFTLAPSERRWPRGLSVAGLVGCAVLAISVARWILTGA